jgi:putative DNA primase/helicase
MQSQATEAATAWRIPDSFSDDLDAIPYPIDALPRGIREAVQEVQEFTQAPVALVASSALTAISAAIQCHFDVARDNVLRGPVSLYMLTLGEPNERKSEVDRRFMKPIRDWEVSQNEQQRELVGEHKASFAAWEARRDAALDKVRKETDQAATSHLAEIEAQVPPDPLLPRMLLTDVTPEALAFHLAKRWPVGCVASAEGGAIFGGHAMSQDSITRNLSLFNKLWSGETISIDRKTSDRLVVNNARMTVGIMVQPAVIRAFASRNGALARGSGFFARFLMSRPETTQGTRLYREPPRDWPALDNFYARITSLLNRPVSMTEARSLEPFLLIMSDGAKAVWVAAHDDLEKGLAPGQELELVRDVAGKAADNIARLAALFHVFEIERGLEIGELHVLGASQIVGWHVNEARRVLGELQTDPRQSDARRLDRWLIDRCKRTGTYLVGRRDAQQLGPVRDPVGFAAAIAELDDMGRAREESAGKRKFIAINPGLAIGDNP